MKKGEENESHLSIQLTAERKGMDMANKSLTSCETLLKKFIDKNDGLKCENAELGENVRFLLNFFHFKKEAMSFSMNPEKLFFFSSKR